MVQVFTVSGAMLGYSEEGKASLFSIFLFGRNAFLVVIDGQDALLSSKG